MNLGKRVNPLVNSCDWNFSFPGMFEYLGKVEENESFLIKLLPKEVSDIGKVVGKENIPSPHSLPWYFESENPKFQAFLDLL